MDAFILAIGEVIYADYVKLSILTARDAYDKLTEEQKALVAVYAGAAGCGSGLGESWRRSMKRRTRIGVWRRLWTR